MTQNVKDWLAARTNAIQTVIDPIPNFDQTGVNSWRAAHDRVFLDAVNTYNAEHGLHPGDPGYWTADLLKAQAMKETGGNKNIFLTDPMHVNNPPDWSPEKAIYTDLIGPYQPMNPALSTRAALQWLDYNYKIRHMPQGYAAPNEYYHALFNYNGNSRLTDASAPLENRIWYPNVIMALAREAEAHRRQR